jgi:hypothetical protein
MSRLAGLLRRRPKSHRRWNPAVAAEVLEERRMPSWVVTAKADDVTGHHRLYAIGNVANNDYVGWDGNGSPYSYDPQNGYSYTPPGPMVRAVVTDPQHGTLQFNPDTGDFTYTPTGDFVGDDSFVYSASVGGPVSQATVSIHIINEPPTWDEWSLRDLEPAWSEADEPIWQNGEMLGAIGAYDATGVHYSGSGDGLTVMDNGAVVVTDGVALTQAALAGPVSFAVFATDGAITVANTLVLDNTIGTNIIGQRQIQLGDTAGGWYEPSTATELLTILEGIRARGQNITFMSIKGHGSPDGIEVGDNVTFLTSVGNTIAIGDEDVTQLLKDVTNTGTRLELRGCNTIQLAKRVKVNLDGAKVWGSSFWVLGIPWTDQIIGPGGWN